MITKIMKDLILLRIFSLQKIAMGISGLFMISLIIWIIMSGLWAYVFVGQ